MQHIYFKYIDINKVDFRNYFWNILDLLTLFDISSDGRYLALEMIPTRKGF